MDGEIFLYLDLNSSVSQIDGDIYLRNLDINIVHLSISS